MPFRGKHCKKLHNDFVDLGDGPLCHPLTQFIDAMLTALADAVHYPASSSRAELIQYLLYDLVHLGWFHFCLYRCHALCNAFEGLSTTKDKSLSALGCKPPLLSQGKC